MTEQRDETPTRDWLAARLAGERERARRLRAATSLLAVAALGLVVAPSLPWAVSADEHTLDPFRTLQLDEPGLWRADGWFLVQDSLARATTGSLLVAVLVLLPLVVAGAAGWAFLRQDRGGASAASVAGGLGAVALLVIGLRVLDGPGLDLHSGFWLAVASSLAAGWGGVTLGRALRAGD